MEKTKLNQKQLAVFLCLLMFFMWIQTVWMPFFAGLAPRPDTKVGDLPTVTQAPTAASNTTLPHPAAQPQTLPPPQVAQLPQTIPPQVVPPVPGSSSQYGRYPTDREIAQGGEIIVQTASIRVTISLLGGRFTRFLLNDYAEIKAPNSPRLDLIEHAEGSPLPLGIYSGTADDAWVRYELISSGEKFALRDGTGQVFELSSAATETFTLRGTFPDGRIIEKRFTFSGSGYIIPIEVALQGSASDQSRLELEWAELILPNSASLLDPYNISGYVWFDGQKAHHETFPNLKTDHQDLGPVHWVSESDKYFMASLISNAGPLPARILKQDQLFSARIAGESERASFKLYIGPKEYHLLQTVGFELHRNIDFGWAAFVSAPMLFLLQFLYKIFANYGVAIVALTIVVRGAMFPLNMASFKQMKAMQKLQPELKRIRESIKDRQEQQLQMMQLYKKNGVNPVGGCLPALAQFPIFIGLYYALLLAIDLRHAPFAVWINDLSAPEKLMVGGVGIPVMVILWVITMLIQQWMTPMPDPVQKRMMMVMPIIFGFMLRLCPAGVTLYWLTGNLISIGQQRALNVSGVKAALQVTVISSLVVLGLAYLLSKLS